MTSEEIKRNNTRSLSKTDNKFETKKQKTAMDKRLNMFFRKQVEES